MTIKRTAGIPLYVQIRETLRGELSHMKAGATLPTEAELSARFGVSLITVRKATEGLSNEGLLVRRQGKGTFVARPKLTHELNGITSWTEQLRALGYVPGTAHREVQEIVPDPEVAQLLGLGEAATVIVMKRLRLADGEPVSLMVNYLPSRLVPGFVNLAVPGESLYELLAERYSLIPANALDTVETRDASEEEAELLQIATGAAVLQVGRVSYLQDGRPLEATEVVSRGDRYQYRVRLKGCLRLSGAPSDAILQFQNESAF